MDEGCAELRAVSGLTHCACLCCCSQIRLHVPSAASRLLFTRRSSAALSAVVAATMGNNLTTPEELVLMDAYGRAYMSHAQALIDCYPESKLSAAEKQHCFAWLEEHPRVPPSCSTIEAGR